MKGANPWVLRRRGAWTHSETDFHPDEHWVVATTNNRTEVSFWPLSWPRPFVADGWRVYEFTQDGRHLLSSDPETRGGNWGNQLRLWPLPGNESSEIVDLMLPAEAARYFRGVTIDANSERVVTRGYGLSLFVIPLNGEEPLHFDGFAPADVVDAVSFSPGGQLVAAASMTSDGQATLRVWDLQTGKVRFFDQPSDPEAYEGFEALALAFENESTLYTAGANGLLQWDIESGTFEQLRRAPAGGLLRLYMTSDHRKMCVEELGPSWTRKGPLDLYDLRTGDVRSVNIPGEGWLALSPDGTVWASGEKDGSIWVGRMDGGEAHVLTGHEGLVFGLAISPDLRWIASSGIDKTLRLWPMPDLGKPPLHTLPHDELIAKLKTFTNIRVVRDEESSTGWKVEIGPFPGWAEVPEW